MENPEEILHSLEEFSKLKPKDIPKELEDYLCFVAKTGDPVYQWGTIKSLFKEKLINVITDFYESCPSVEIPPCPNVEVFNYESMKTFILEKLDTFAAAPFTVQRICELLCSPRKEYNRIDKYMRALEKNILVVSTTEPGFRRATENGEGIVNGIETEHLPDSNSLNNDINVEEMDDAPVWSRITPETVTYQQAETNVNSELQSVQSNDTIHSAFSTELKTTESNCPNTIDSVITRRPSSEQPYVSIEPVISDSCLREETVQESDITVTITAIPAAVQKRRDSIEPVVSTGEEIIDEPTKLISIDDKENSQSLSAKSDTNVEGDSPSEAEPSNSEETNDTVNVPIDKKEDVEADETYTSNEPIESTLNEEELIQIPIISEISTGTSSEQPSEDANMVPLLSLQNRDEVNADDNAISKEESESFLETSPEVSTTVTSTVAVAEPQTFIRENDTTVSKETSVSSTNELSLDTSRVSCTKQQNIEISVCNEDTLSDSILDTNLNATTEESENNGIEGKLRLSEIREYVASSTNQESMDIDLGEESCQEPPTSDG